MSQVICCFSLIVMLFVTTPASAVVFTSQGKVVRTLSDSENYGQCMVKMDSNINNGCPTRWLSLDCKGTYVGTEAGERNYATALMAASLGKTISMQVDNNKKHDNYCVVKRLDVIF